jgi:hypothetical protein
MPGISPDEPRHGHPMIAAYQDRHPAPLAAATTPRAFEHDPANMGGTVGVSQIIAELRAEVDELTAGLAKSMALGTEAVRQRDLARLRVTDLESIGRGAMGRAGMAEQERDEAREDRDKAVACIAFFVNGSKMDGYEPTYLSRGPWLALCEIEANPASCGETKQGTGKIAEAIAAGGPVFASYKHDDADGEECPCNECRYARQVDETEVET